MRGQTPAHAFARFGMTFRLAMQEVIECPESNLARGNVNVFGLTADERL
jgi:hypothetical protein